jgi:hypothetical protein
MNLRWARPLAVAVCAVFVLGCAGMVAVILAGGQGLSQQWVVERIQLRWIVLGGCVLATAFVLALVLPTPWGDAAITVGPAAFSISLGVAVLRSRLFAERLRSDIDGGLVSRDMLDVARRAWGPSSATLWTSGGA